MVMGDERHVINYMLPPAGREAASTKWNFHSYKPGLVGGHCIPVDPYYLVYKAKELGYHPQVILAGRAVTAAPSVMSERLQVTDHILPPEGRRARKF